MFRGAGRLAAGSLGTGAGDGALALGVPRGGPGATRGAVRADVLDLGHGPC
jgi:hypothetical protein